MKYQRFCVYIIAVILSMAINGQDFTSLGLGADKCGRKSNLYYPQMHVEGDILYVCTNQGLYSKDLSTDDSAWQLAGFEGVPLQNYVRKGEDILALQKNANGNFLILSHDGGKTYDDVTPDSFKGQGSGGNALLRLVQHPTGPDTLLISCSYLSSQYGIFRSTDFGQTWSQLATIVPKFLGYHPLNPGIIYTSGNDPLSRPCIYNSYDGGKTWDDCSPTYPGDNSINCMAFHPTNPDKWVVGGSHSVYTSTDNGHTWNTQDYMFDVKSARWCFAAFDSEKSDIVYMAGSVKDSIKVMCSTDGGMTWNTPIAEPMNNVTDIEVNDLQQYGDKLIVYTESDVYVISKPQLIPDSVNPIQENDNINLKDLPIFDMLGREQPSEPIKGFFIINGKKVNMK